MFSFLNSNKMTKQLSLSGMILSSLVLLSACDNGAKTDKDAAATIEAAPTQKIAEVEVVDVVASAKEYQT